MVQYLGFNDVLDISASEILKGDCDDNLQVKISNRGIMNCYEEGKEYVFIISHIDSVYVDKYLCSDFIFIPVNDSENAMVFTDLLIDEIGMELIEYIKTYEFTSDGAGDELSGDYTHSDDTKTIVTEADGVALVKITELYYEYPQTNEYKCKVIKDYKDNIPTDGNGEIIVLLFKDRVEVGDKVIVCLHCENEDEFYYTLSAKASVFDMADDEIISEYLR